MEIVWYVTLLVLLGTYIILDGYDLGSGVAYLFFAESIDEKKKIIKSIRSVWDANEVWIFSFIFILYLVFPKFSMNIFNIFGGYILLFILFMLLKIIAFNLMLTFENKKTKDIFGFLFGFFSIMIIVFISIILSNIIRGIYPDNQKELLLIGKSFSPFMNEAGIFDWFTVLTSTIIFVTILIHGLVWIILKNKGIFNKKLKIKVQRLSLILMILSIVFGISWQYIHPNIYKNYFKFPFLFIFPFIYLSSLAGLMAIRTYQGENKGFILSTNLIITGLISIFAAVYPRLSISLDNEKITIFNTEFYDPKKFYLQFWIIGLAVLFLIYSILIHKYNKGKIS